MRRKLRLVSPLVKDLQIVDNGDRPSGGIGKIADDIVRANLIGGHDFQSVAKVRRFASSDRIVLVSLAQYIRA